MSMMRRWMSGGRLRRAKRDLAKITSPKNYAALAREYAHVGDLVSVQRICEEGLEDFPGAPELVRLLERTRQMTVEDRTRELYRELRESPRAGVWRELCDLLLEAERVARAEECAEEWFAATQLPEALFYRARARVQRFFLDRRREDGRAAFELLDKVEKLMHRDPEPMRLRLEIAERIGAWKEARRALGMLLEIMPGDQALEARFRTLVSLAEGAPTPDQALRTVEKTGRLVDEQISSTDTNVQASAIRPRLQEMALDDAVKAAVYVRGGTALVQGPRGATAERAARAVREIVQSSRTAARRLGLGQAIDIRLEGSFGHCLVTPGELGSGALWCDGSVPGKYEATLLELVGATSFEEEEQA